MNGSRMWLIRRKDLTFLRPLPEKELVEMIEAGRLDRRDEVCLSGGYWFPLGDAYEVRKYLGSVRLEALLTGLADSDTATHTDVGITRIVQPENQASPATGTSAKVPAMADLKSRESVSEAKDPREVNPRTQRLFMVLLMVIFVYTLFLIWMNSQG